MQRVIKSLMLHDFLLRCRHSTLRVSNFEHWAGRCSAAVCMEPFSNRSFYMKLTARFYSQRCQFVAWRYGGMHLI